MRSWLGMDSNKYDELIEDTLKVKDDIDRRMHSSNGVDVGVMAAIIVASQHSSYSYESKTKTPGQKMKEYRLSHGLSQEQLAKQLGISRPYMS